MAKVGLALYYQFNRDEESMAKKKPKKKRPEKAAVGAVKKPPKDQTAEFIQAQMAAAAGQPPPDPETPGHEIHRIEPIWGVTDDTPFWNYLMWDAYGSGSVRKIGHSPAHHRSDRINGVDMKAIMVGGKALHACVLEPDTEWPKYHRLAPGVTRAKAAGKEAMIEYGREFVLLAHEYDSCMGGRDRLFEHSRIGKLLRNGRPEVSFAWEDEETGIPLKGRADWVSQGIPGGAVLDLKRTGDAREARFARVAREMGYPVQGSHYVTGLRHHEEPVEHYCIVACEADPPYEPVLYRVGERDMIVAESYHRTLVDFLARCIETDTWPGYPERVHVLHMGQWWESEIQGRIATLTEEMERL